MSACRQGADARNVRGGPTRILVVGAHPDDEAIGCGGTLRCHVLAGDDVRALFLTSGENGGHGIDHPGETREREALQAAKILGLGDIQFWHEPDGRLRARRELVQRLAGLIAAWRPSLIYAPHERDDHPDHRCAARLTASAAASSGHPSEIRQYEIWSPVIRIDHVVDISEAIDDKLRAIRAYRSQCAVMRFDDAFAGLARYRGEMHSWPGGAYAEVFSAR
jgi:N-acetylglucosamine malate deacetylase 1